MTQAETDLKISQAIKNFTEWWIHNGIEPPTPLFCGTSRIWYPRTDKFILAIEDLVTKGILSQAFAGDHGVDIQIGYRENISNACAASV